MIPPILNYQLGRLDWIPAFERCFQQHGPLHIIRHCQSKDNFNLTFLHQPSEHKTQIFEFNFIKALGTWILMSWQYGPLPKAWWSCIVSVATLTTLICIFFCLIYQVPCQKKFPNLSLMALDYLSAPGKYFISFFACYWLSVASFICLCWTCMLAGTATLKLHL